MILWLNAVNQLLYSCVLSAFFFYLHERCYQQLQVFGKNKIFNFMIITSQPIKESLDYIHLWVREKDEEKTCYVFSGLKISLNIIHNSPKVKSIQFSSLGQSCPTRWDPMDFCMTCFPVHHQVPENTQPHIQSQWCHPTISSSAVPFFCLQSFPASGYFPMSQFFASCGQSIGVAAQSF